MEARDVDGPRAGDAFGAALLHRYEGGSNPVIIERDDGLVAVDESGYLEQIEDSHLWRWIRGRLGRRVLDIGAGGGRGALALQADGVDVVALDVSEGAIEVCRRRGITSTYLGTVEQYAATAPAAFDSFLCLGNNIGLIGSPEGASQFFDAVRAISKPGPSIVGTMLDPYATTDPLHLEYHERNRRAGRLAGQVRLRVRHHRLATPWFELLWLSPDELSTVAGASGWQVVDLSPGSVYGAELRPR